MNIQWNADNYISNFSFVHRYGEDVLKLIDLPQGSYIADVGCGGGQLTSKLAATGYAVLGLDASEQMIACAKAAYPDLAFEVADATNFTLPRPADGIFSNAVFHWIDDQKKLIQNISRNLRTGGQLACEFGGKGCAEAVHAELERQFSAEGLSYKRTFYFPTIGEYAPLLEQGGLRPVYCALFPRPTRQRGADGLKNWIKTFVKEPFYGIEDQVIERILERSEQSLKSRLYKGASGI